MVEQIHRTIQLLPGPAGRKTSEPTKGITGFVYRSVRGTTRLIGKGIDAGLAPLAAVLPDGDSNARRDAYVSALNGVYGDYLARTENPFAIEMSLVHQGLPVDPDHPPAALVRPEGKPAQRLLILVHGLCMNDQQWLREDHDHGTALADELAYTPLYLRYNSGLGIPENGRLLADTLERLIAHWPHPPEELVMVGHSMGGLVARSACHQGSETGHAWLKHLRKLVFLGTPHHGAPLERGGHGLDFLLDISPYSAPFTRIGKSRSAGITDLRHGSVTSSPKKRVPLPPDVACYAAAATLAPGTSALRERLIGDGLVPLNSALGIHGNATRHLAIPPDQQWVGYNMGHLELLNRPEVYAQLREWLL
jgi:pimeloyl-ACP methyl ester carboxylesterase